MRRDVGVFGAVTGLGAMVTAGFSWTAVLTGWAISGVLLAILPRDGTMKKRGDALLVLLGGVCVLAAVALGAEDAFPEDSTFPFVSAAVLLLLWRGMCGERRSLSAAANVLGLFLAAVLGAVTVFGLQDVRWEETVPGGFSWWQVYVTVAAVSPWWLLRRGARTAGTWGWFAASAAVCLSFSLLTWGILGSGLAVEERFPLYRAVQTIRILGVLQRFEAMLAAAVLMGAFAVMLLTGDRIAESLDTLLPRCRRKWKSGAVVAAAFGLEWAFRLLPAQLTALGNRVFWGLLPPMALFVVFLEKTEKKRKKS